MEGLIDSMVDNDSLDMKRNKPLNRKIAGSIFAVILGLALMTFITPDPKTKKGVQTAAPKYTMSAPQSSLRDRPIETEEDVVTAVPKDTPPQVVFRIDRNPTLPVQTDPENETAPPQAAPASPQQVRPRAANNPLRQQWMSQQLQAFTSSPKTSNWGTLSDQSSPTQNVQPGTPGSGLMDLYRQEIERSLENEKMTPQERFFANAGGTTKGTLAHTRQKKAAPYTIPAGTMIPCVLITGINSDLPGNLTAQVSENVCDWVNPRVVLIPQGTRVFGVYDSNQEFGQKRVQVKWSRLTFPDGSTLDLEGMPGVDRQGYSGLKDRYNAHYNAMFTAAVLVSAFSVLGEVFNDNKSTVVIGGSGNVSTVESAVAQSVASMGEKIFSKFVDRQPTIVVRPGKTFHIQANADIPFERIWAVL